MPNIYDVVIIGAGSAGLAAQKEVSRQTSNYLVVDGGPIGTVCARVGCMPSKALIEAANAYHQRNKFAQIGVAGVDQLRLDGAATLKHVRALRDKYVQSVIAGMKPWMTENFKAGHAHFTTTDTIQVEGEIIRAKKFIIATGSRPKVPAAWSKIPGVITTDDIFDLESLPKTLGVIGLGPVGIEMTQAFARLGVKVTAFSKKNSIAGFTDPKLVSYSKEAFRRDFELLESDIQNASAHAGGVRLKTETATFDFEKVLVAMGREPNLDLLKLENAGVKKNSGGEIDIVDGTFRIEGTHLYLIGDVNRQRPVLHESVDQGRIAGSNAVKKSDQVYPTRTALRITFCAPNGATVGKTWKELTDANVDFVSGEVCFENQGRAVEMMENVGHLALYVDRISAELLGAELFAPAGEHFAHLLNWSIEDKKTVLDLLSKPFYHPVLEEGLRTALKNAAEQIKEGPKQMKDVRCDDPAAGTALTIRT